MERNKLAALGDDKDFDNEIFLTADSMQEICWWYSNIVSKNVKRIRPIKPQKYCRTDASFLGWGSVDLDSSRYANGRWTYKESENLINYLELLAIFYALQSFYDKDRGVDIEIQSDNTSAIKYINDNGGIVSEPMDRLAGKIWQWCLERKIYISVVYVPGAENTADFYSRNFSDSTEWMLKKPIFDRLCRQFFFPNIDLFSSRMNAQLE